MDEQNLKEMILKEMIKGQTKKTSTNVLPIIFHCSRCYRGGSKSNKQMWSRRTRDMLDAKHPASVNVHKLRCLECTAHDHNQDTHAMQCLRPGPKQYDKCSLCDVVLSHTKGTGCNVSKAQWTSKRHGDRLCLDCAANKRARCCRSKADDMASLAEIDRK